MSEYGTIAAITHKAAADISGAQYHFMRYTAGDTVNISSLATAEDYAGVLLNKPDAANRAATVAVAGETKITAGGALTVNDLVTTNGSGRAAAATSGDFVMGRVLETAGANGDVVRMLLMPFFTGDLA